MTDKQSPAPASPCNANVRHVGAIPTSGATWPRMPEHYVIELADGPTVRAVPAELYEAEVRRLSDIARDFEDQIAAMSRARA